jgi:hypothetical protein
MNKKIKLPPDNAVLRAARKLGTVLAGADRQSSETAPGSVPSTLPRLGMDVRFRRC